MTKEEKALLDQAYNDIEAAQRLIQQVREMWRAKAQKDQSHE